MKLNYNEIEWITKTTKGHNMYDLCSPELYIRHIPSGITVFEGQTMTMTQPQKSILVDKALEELRKLVEEWSNGRHDEMHR